MNPLERLRYISRIEGADPVDLALDAVYVIAELANDRSVLVSALRRLLDRQPSYGILWMVAARIAGSVFPEDEAWTLIGELSMPRSSSPKLEPPCLVVERSGRMTIVDRSRDSVKLGNRLDQAAEFLAADPAAALVVESDLASTQFALLPGNGVELMEHSSLRASRLLIVNVSDLAVVSPDVRESLELRLVALGRQPSKEIVSLGNSHRVRYQGNLLAPQAASYLADWRVPQELLHSAGPMLG